MHLPTYFTDCMAALTVRRVSSLLTAVRGVHGVAAVALPVGAVALVGWMSFCSASLLVGAVCCLLLLSRPVAALRLLPSLLKMLVRCLLSVSPPLPVAMETKVLYVHD